MRPRRVGLLVGLLLLVHVAIWYTFSSATASCYLNDALPGIDEVRHRNVSQHKHFAGCSVSPSSFMPVALSAVCPRKPFDFSSIYDRGERLSPLQAPLHELAYCELSLLHTDACASEESARDCVLRLGPQALEKVLARKCTMTYWFQKLKNESMEADEDSATPRSSKVISGGRVLRSMIDAGRRVRWVPPSERPNPAGFRIPWWQPKNLPCMANRIPMGIPEEIIVDEVERQKLFDVYPLMPPVFPFQKKFKYGFGSNDEALLREAQRRSYFTVTHRRGCWTAQRHYDGLAAGSVPLFVDIRLSDNPELDLPMYPVELMREAIALPGVSHHFTDVYSDEVYYRTNDTATRVAMMQKPPADFLSPGRWYRDHPVFNVARVPDVNWDVFDHDRYFTLAEKLLRYTKANLTTKAVASHFLRSMGIAGEKAKRVLIFQSFFLPEMCTLMHGLASLGIDVYSRRIYTHAKMEKGTDEPTAALERLRRVWRGFRSSGHMYMFRAPRQHMFECDNGTATDEDGEQQNASSCLDLIQQNHFDLVVYSVNARIMGKNGLHGAANRFPYLDEVVKLYGPSRIAFIDGADGGKTTLPVAKQICGLGKIFSRERQARM